MKTEDGPLPPHGENDTQHLPKMILVDVCRSAKAANAILPNQDPVIVMSGHSVANWTFFRYLDEQLATNRRSKTGWQNSKIRDFSHREKDPSFADWKDKETRDKEMIPDTDHLHKNLDGIGSRGPRKRLMPNGSILRLDLVFAGSIENKSLQGIKNVEWVCKGYPSHHA